MPSHGLRFQVICASTTKYAPKPKNAACPNEIMPL